MYLPHTVISLVQRGKRGGGFFRSVYTGILRKELLCGGGMDALWRIDAQPRKDLPREIRDMHMPPNPTSRSQFGVGI